MQKTNITTYLDTEYASYGMYTIEHRAIPSVVDGFKPTQRKIIYIANKTWKTLSEKPLKVFQFTGKVASGAAYHHGDSSCNSAVISMAQKFKNSLPLLEGIGQFGTLRSVEAGAPRYISVKLNQNFKLLYKDFDLVTPKYEEGEEIEPLYFLPIIPTVLLNGTSGIAVGFATNILNRNPKELIDVCLAKLEGKKSKDPLPWLADFNGEVINVENNSFLFKGKYEILNTTNVRVTELPPSMTYEKYENHLNSLQEAGHIQFYDDNCDGKKIDYNIKFTRAELANRIKKSQLEKLLKLNESETENLTCLDENGKLIQFDTLNNLIDYFINFRLSYYDKRKAFELDKSLNELKVLSNRARFIKLIIDQKLKINNRPKTDIIEDVLNLKFDKVNDTFDYLLNMSIVSLTKERYEQLLKEIELNKIEYDKIFKSNPKDIYIEDLKMLKKALTK